MASNKTTWVRNLHGATEPLIMLGKFAAGVTVPIKRGEILELTGSTNTEWVPIDSDFSMAGNIAVANEEIKSGDRAGYYEIIVPRPGDVFEFATAAGAAHAVGDDFFYSASQTIAATGTNALAYAVGQENYPQKQGHLSDDAGGDAGTTIKSLSYARVCFKLAVSYFAAFNK
ncbi:MAG: hypothetical protein AABY46_07250 [Nitrospirota bacterium]